MRKRLCEGETAAACVQVRAEERERDLVGVARLRGERCCRLVEPPDVVVLTDIYAAGEAPIPGVTLDELAAHVRENVTFDVMRKAVIYGSVLASFCVEAFSLERLRTLRQSDIDARYHLFQSMSQFEA